jgi:hypothetical protein
MSLNNNDIKNEIFPKNITDTKIFTKEMLQELLKNQLDQRLLKLESNSKEHISNLNYTAKYFTEFTKAIQQFTKFFEESESLIEKEKELTEIKESIENDNTEKFILKKSNESNYLQTTTNIPKNNINNNNNKSHQKEKENNKKLENTLKNKSITQNVFKPQKLKKQSTNMLLAKSIFTNKVKEEKKTNANKTKIMSPEIEKKNQSKKIINISKNVGKHGTPQRLHKTNNILERSINLKTPKTEIKNKTATKIKKLKNTTTRHKTESNLSEYKNIKGNENEKFEKSKTNRDNYNTAKNYEQNALNKTMNKKSKKKIKSKKEIKFNLQNNENNENEDFSKTLANHFVNKTIELDKLEREKRMHLNSSLTNKKKSNIRLNNESHNSNFIDIANIVKLVDDVNQNINKLLESNEKLNNNKSLMMSSLDLSSSQNKTFLSPNFRSTVNIFNSNINEDINNTEKKENLIKKKQGTHNISLYKDYNDNNKENIQNSPKTEQKMGINEIGSRPIKTEYNKFINNTIMKKSKEFNENVVFENKRYQTECNNSYVNENETKEICETETIINFDVIKIFKSNKKILKNIFKYLKDFEIITFTSSNNYLNKERIALLDNKKEELLLLLNLQKDETMETKINKIMNEYSEEDISKPPDIFHLSNDAENKLKELNNNDNIQKIFNNDLDMNNNNKDFKFIIIIYKILFILLDIEEIYSVLNDDIFWKKCCNYLKVKVGKNIGDFIIEKIPGIKFNSKTINLIDILIKDNKENIINEISNEDNKCLIKPFIKEIFEYCGIIFVPKITQGSIIINHLKNNQMVINYLNNLKVRYFLAKYEEEDDDD